MTMEHLGWIFEVAVTIFIVWAIYDTVVNWNSEDDDE